MQLWNTLNKEELEAYLRTVGHKFVTISFYQYAKIAHPRLFRDHLFLMWSKLDIVGRTYVAKEGINAAEHIAYLEKKSHHLPQPLDYNNIPGCTYCTPEIASVGYTEKAAKDAGYEIKVGKFPFMASGKASAAGAKDGFVKLIFDAKYGELLGGHMIGANVTEMVAELVAVRKLETTGHELIKTVHPHPTMSEAVMEAAAAAYGEVIHM
jgi:dihydrolipoamide dehydrogenase